MGCYDRNGAIFWSTFEDTGNTCDLTKLMIKTQDCYFQISQWAGELHEIAQNFGEEWETLSLHSAIEVAELLMKNGNDIYLTSQLLRNSNSIAKGEKYGLNPQPIGKNLAVTFVALTQLCTVVLCNGTLFSTKNTHQGAVIIE